MTDDEINQVVSKLLYDRFGALGFEYSTVKSEQDFDNTFIIRATAHFKNDEIPAERLIEANHDIQSELVKRGEERFVFLTREFPHQEMVDEDLE